MVGRPTTPLHQLVQDAADRLVDRIGSKPKIAMLLGTGHASIAGQLKHGHQVSPHDLSEHFRLGEGNIIAGALEGVQVIVANAPLAPYEGHSPRDVTFPVRVLRAAGAELLVLSAGAASLSPHLEPGTVCVVEDHINFSGIHPLQGPYDPRLGPRFPDMSEPYSAHWRNVARSVGHEVGMSCLPGIFAAVPGPSLPTRAEYRFLRRAGADLVGMSLVPEVLAAVHSGFDVLALVGVTQLVSVENAEPIDIESMLDAADLAAPRMASLLSGIVARSTED